MSRQDEQRCAKCGQLCGYDDRKGVWYGGNLAICGQCKDNLANRFVAFFGMDGYSSDEYGIAVGWEQMDRILSNIKRDDSMGISYIVTDKDRYLRTKSELVPVEE